jgi:hypothetical protein
MKRLIAIILALATLGVLAPAVSAHPGPDRTLRQRIVRLEAKVQAQSQRINTLSTQVYDLTLWSACANALTWDGLDAIVLFLGADPGPPLDDGGACAALGIVRRSAKAERNPAGLLLQSLAASRSAAAQLGVPGP